MNATEATESAALYMPNTPLPWARDSVTGAIAVQANSGNEVATFNGKRPQSIDNCTYAVHAANAYPKLVGALLNAATEHTSVCEVRGDDGKVLHKDTRCTCGLVWRLALLRQIGESL